MRPPKFRIAVFIVLAAWAVYDAAMTFDDWRELGLLWSIGGFCGSLFLSSFFITGLYLLWDWLARRFHHG